MTDEEIKALENRVKYLENEVEVLSRIAQTAADYGRISYENGCYYNGHMRVDNEVVSLYTDLADTRTTFSIMPGKSFIDKLKKAKERMRVKKIETSLVVIGQGDNRREINK